MFSKIRKSFGAFLSPSKPSATQVAVWKDGKNRHNTKASNDQSAAKLEDLEDENRDEVDGFDLEGDTLLVRNSTGKKRRISMRTPCGSAKRRRVDVESPEDVNDNSSDFEGSTLLTSTPLPMSKIQTTKSKAATDRVLMPPPNLPNVPKQHRVDDETSETSSVNSSVFNKRISSDIEDFDADEGRRKAEAIVLPENSGVWAEAETQLFYHLAARGLEPLLPENWMIDFRTLPLSLYARGGGAEALISSHHDPEFRAIRALRDLISLGQSVRDRTLASRRLPAEPTIERGIGKYVSWALRDVGMHPSQRPSVIPVHVITAMGKGQTTQDALRDLSRKLHALATRWRRAHNIRDSVERNSTTPPSNDETQIAEDDDDLPILTGILICSSLMMVVTLNAHTLPPASLTAIDSLEGLLSPPESGSATSHNSTEDTGLRMIATFDFSDARVDVWNALAVAIVAMSTRTTMVKQFELASRTGRGLMWETVDQRGPGRDMGVDPDL